MRIASPLPSTVGIVVLVALGGCQCNDTSTKVTPGRPARSPNPPAPTAASVPRTRAPITLDGVFDEPDWVTTYSLTIQLRGEDGDFSRPYAEVRFLHDDAKLYVALYAADTNVTSDDAFDVDVGTLHARVFANGKIEPPAPDLKMSVNVDGTIDNPASKDEEWRVELAIPLTLAGFAPGAGVDTHVGRCDTMKDGSKLCGNWTGKLSLQ
jgi:hypothetical protein